MGLAIYAIDRAGCDYRVTDEFPDDDQHWEELSELECVLRPWFKRQGMELFVCYTEPND